MKERAQGSWDEEQRFFRKEAFYLLLFLIRGSEQQPAHIHMVRQVRPRRAHCDSGDKLLPLGKRQHIVTEGPLKQRKADLHVAVSVRSCSFCPGTYLLTLFFVFCFTVKTPSPWDLFVYFSAWGKF